MKRCIASVSWGKWGVEEAVREILQNAIDQKADGAEVSVSYDRETLSILTDGARLKTSTLLDGILFEAVSRAFRKELGA